MEPILEEAGLETEAGGWIPNVECSCSLEEEDVDCVDKEGRRSDPSRRPEEMESACPKDLELMLPRRRAPGAGTELAVRFWAA